ncbi:hypothetical protein M422DRAFT_251122 [Sphaerobolus stellatus SS14]|uniref:Uncharacterized protein n=1 Tax=Sphaerobolus stellatus (strain SS14) TaxID=990650 RepID=A0A0C9VS99_SPHS4|nr:hypothetical protein M422DRAFT_251122 [Sphaerobolus stellatus SS14]
MAYNLIFEIVRGNIHFPESYGVRDQSRASIQTVKALLPVAKQKMKSYIEANTVAWIPSNIYFEFWIRRIQELSFLQTRVAKNRPSNACNLTLLIMYLIKCTVTNPREHSFTHFVLRDLNFQPSSQHFGIFFLPTLHRKTLAVDQMEPDDDSVLQYLTNTRGKCKQCPKDFSEDPRRTAEYPLGTHPSWEDIIDILNTNPTLIVNTRPNLMFWESEQGQIHHLVIHLLSKCTHNYTCTVNQTFLKHQENYPKPVNWQDILNFWTVLQIQDVFHAPAFKPHKAHWTGLPHGPRQLSFGDRFNAFFPPLETHFSTSSLWHLLKTTGYLKDYHHFLNTKSDHEILSLQDGLKAAFELFECLPDKCSAINSQPWKYHSEKGGPTFIINAKTYKICGVGHHKKTQKQPRPRAVATHTHIEALLIADQLQVPFDHAFKQIKGYNQQAHKQDRRTTRSRNKRKPPQLNHQQSRTSNLSEIGPEVEQVPQQDLSSSRENTGREHVEDEEESEEDSDQFSIESEDLEDD